MQKDIAATFSVRRFSHFMRPQYFPPEHTAG